MKKPATIPRNPKKEDYRSLLLAKRKELLGSLEDTKFDTIARMGRVAEEDQGQIAHEEFISLQRNSMDYSTLRLVTAAIERLDSGEYGTCLECEEPISDKRLKAIPWAKYCVACQDRMHREENHEDVREMEQAATW